MYKRIEDQRAGEQCNKRTSGQENKITNTSGGVSPPLDVSSERARGQDNIAKETRGQMIVQNAGKGNEGENREQENRGPSERVNEYRRTRDNRTRAKSNGERWPPT